MNVASTDNQLTTLLDNQMLARLERLRLQPNRRKTNRTQGEHAVGKGGSSTEFADETVERTNAQLEQLEVNAERTAQILGWVYRGEVDRQASG